MGRSDYIRTKTAFASVSFEITKVLTASRLDYFTPALRIELKR